MTVKQIVAKYLEENGYTGLCDNNCGCGRNDLFACGECYPNCEAAHHYTCKCGNKYYATSRGCCSDCAE